MNLSPEWLPFLADTSVEAEHWSSIGDAAAADTEIAVYAREHGFVILTQDTDFGTMLAITQETKPSVIQIRSDDAAPEAIRTRVVHALKQMQSELRAGAILTIDVSRARLRLLPFE